MAAQCGADFVGLILAPSPRQVTVDTARLVVASLPPVTQPVLVFRDAPPGDVIGAVTATGCTWVQLHGRESAAYLSELAAHRPDLRLIKAWEVIGPDSGLRLAELRMQLRTRAVRVEAYLLDAPKGGPHPGYEMLGQVSASCPARPPEVWCAGGLTPENVATAVAAGSYDCVDVASGVESRPGVKDRDAIESFIRAARAP